MSAETTSNAYDDVPYQSDPFPQTHPQILATIATLFGMQPPPVENCRVLEIGSAAGGNLIPMAVEMPGCKAVGFDLSPRQIDEAVETVKRLDLKNIEFQVRNIMDVDKDFGEFDYIIAHGIYSWVPAPVATQILKICKQNLSPQGVAYVSYNTLPGWHMRGMIRDMMRYHVQHFTQAAVQVREAKGLLKFLAESVPDKNNPYGLYLKHELNFLQQMRDSYIYHDHLEKENNPVYFHEFMERAEQQELQYLGEALFGSMALAAHDLAPSVMETLQQVTDNTIHREQYMDFVRNRTFRQTLLCHKEVALDLAPKPASFARLHVTSRAKPAPGPVDLASQKPHDFTLDTGETVPVRLPLVKAALLHLAQTAPGEFRFDNLCAAVCQRLRITDEAQIAAAGETLAHRLQSLTARSFVNLSVVEQPPSRAAGEHPQVSPWVRLQAERGNIVTNRRHRSVQVDEFERRILPLLDGQRNLEDLLDRLSELVADGTLVIRTDAVMPLQAEARRKLLEQNLEGRLRRFKECQLLVA